MGYLSFLSEITEVFLCSSVRCEHGEATPQCEAGDDDGPQRHSQVRHVRPEQTACELMQIKENFRSNLHFSETRSAAARSRAPASRCSELWAMAGRVRQRGVTWQQESRVSWPQPREPRVPGP